MGLRGPKPYEATPEKRQLVQHYAALGYTQTQIAGLIGCSEPILREHYREELDNGALKINAQVGGKLFQKAMQGDTAALIFWAKTRMGWKETVRQEHAGVEELVDRLSARRARVAKLNEQPDGD